MPRGRPRKNAVTAPRQHEVIEQEGAQAPSVAQHKVQRGVLKHNVVFNGVILKAGSEVEGDVLEALAEYCDVCDG